MDRHPHTASPLYVSLSPTHKYQSMHAHMSMASPYPPLIFPQTALCPSPTWSSGATGKLDGTLHWCAEIKSFSECRTGVIAKPQGIICGSLLTCMCLFHHDECERSPGASRGHTSHVTLYKSCNPPCPWEKRGWREGGMEEKKREGHIIKQKDYSWMLRLGIESFQGCQSL